MKYQIGEKAWITKDKLPFRVEVIGVSTSPESDAPIYKIEPTHRKEFARMHKDNHSYYYCTEQDLFKDVGTLLHAQCK